MKDVAILCEICSGNGDFDTMWPGGDHDDERVWGVAEIETDDSCEWVITWLATRLTVAQAEERLDGMDFGGPVHVIGQPITQRARFRVQGRARTGHEIEHINA